MNEIRIDNEEALREFLKEALAGKKFENTQLKFSEFGDLSIRISGDSRLFDGTLYYSLCKALCDFQTEIWKSYAQFKTGAPDMRRLSAAEKEQLTIKFSVNKGSTEIIASLTEFLNAFSGLLKEVAKNMTGTEIIICFALLALAISVPSVYKTYAESKEKEREQERENSYLQQLQANNERLFALVESMQERVDNAYISIARAVPEAQRIEISGPGRAPININRGGLEQLIHDTNNRLEAPSRLPEELDLFVEALYSKGDDFTATVRLASGEKFNATIDVGMMGEEAVKLVFDSCRRHTVIRLSGLVKRRGENIEHAIFAEVITS